MDCDDWKFLKVLYETKNLTKASKLMFVSQPALTKRLNNLEEKFGVVIAHRSNKGIVFTTEGEYLATQANKFIKLMNEVESEIKSMSNANKNIIRIGAPSSFMKYYLIDILSEYKLNNPDVLIQVSVDVSSMVPSHILSDSVDCAFTLGDTKHSFNGHIFDIQKCYAIYNREFILEELPSIPLILHNRNELTLNAIYQWWRDHFSQPPNVTTHITNLDTALDMVMNGLGFTIAFGSFLEKRREFTILPLYHKKNEPLIRRTWFIYPEKSLAMPQVADFISFIVDRINNKSVETRLTD